MAILAHPLSVTSLHGSDAANFLQGYVTSDTHVLHQTRAMPTAFTDIKGRVLANGWIYGTATDVQLIIHQSTVRLVHEHLAKYLVFSQSRFIDELKPIYISPHGKSESNYPTIEPYGWSTKSNSRDTNYTLEQLFSKKIVLIQQETAALFLPQMIGLTSLDAVSFEKGCYLGQEIIARAEHRGVVKRHTQKYLWNGVKPKIGAEATNASGKAVVVAVADSRCIVVVSKDVSGKLMGENFFLERPNQKTD